MTHFNSISRLLLTLAVGVYVSFAGGNANAALLNLPDSPLFLSSGVPPLNMLVMGRDHKLYYEAYDDHSDLDGKNDGPGGTKTIDTKYKPTVIDYYGYFDSYKCYSYSGGRFAAISETLTGTKKCSGTWSGDFLNYLTTSRLDALRKVLYGGYRSVDDNTTVLERTHVPQDAHSWGKEYTSLAVDGYLINEYSPLAMPTAGTQHLFANTTPLTSNGLSETPRFRYLLNRTERIWNWVSKERPVADTSMDGGGSVTLTLGTNDFIVRVLVCDVSSSLPMEDNCLVYPNGKAKPTGLLQEFGENDSMLFGLLTGSYAKNTSGGVLRRAVGSIRDEIDASNGRFVSSYNGIIKTLNKLQTTGFGGSYEYDCGWASASRVITEGECQMWGNPIAEMMYEALRYFGGKGSATSAYSVSAGAGEEGELPGGSLPVANWDNPYSGRPICTKPFETVISDINPSYDTDQLPGVNSNFGSFTGDVAGLNVSARGQAIWDTEIGGTKRIYIGQVGATSDNAPTPKDASSFGNIRGLSPEEPTKQGGYYAGSVAHFGRVTDINAANGTQNLTTFAVALASPLPQIRIPVGSSNITLVPFGKSVGGSGVTSAFSPTNQIVDFYVDTLTPTSGKFRVNFEDVEQGADHDMDAIVVYEYSVSDNTVTITLTSEYAAGSIIQHMGYVISGTNGSDGTYLVVRDKDTAAASDPDYTLDYPNIAGALPLTSTRTFVAGSSDGASLLQDPLWYAAKWGGFTEGTVHNDIPDLSSEWDENGDDTPDNYFLVTNALTLSQQLSNAFADIISRNASGSSASVNSGSISSESRLYQAKFNSGNWTGQLLAFQINTNGSLGSAPEWDAALKLPAANSRNIITVNSNGVAVPFRWANAPSGLDNTRRQQLDNAISAPYNPTLQQNRMNFIRGDATYEASNGGIFRNRDSKLGDIISSAPAFVGKPSFTYRDSLESSPYSAYRTAKASRKPVVYVGGNDGMLHAFDANSDATPGDDERGKEILAFIPSPVFGNLKALSNRGYSHKFYVDGSPTVGDAFLGGSWKTALVGGLNAGGQGVYALDVTSPETFSEANASSIFLWEFTDANDRDLGYTYSQPLLARVSNSNATKRWVAIFGNGYNNTFADARPSTTGNAVLYVVDLATGALIRKIDTGVGTSASYSGGGPNGLGTPTGADLDGDNIIESVYAGDLFGNLWKFDLSSSDSTQWKVANRPGGVSTPLFVAKDGTSASANRQPITSQVRVIRGPGSAGAIILFGTGKFLEPTDKITTTTRVQSLYGIYDNYTNSAADIVDRSVLQQQTITNELSGTFGTKQATVRVTSNNSIGSSARGWYMDLVTPPSSTYTGERMVATPRVRAGRVLFVTMAPNADPCSAGGKTYLMELDAISGSRLDQPPFDMNGDGQFTDADDNIEVTIGGTLQRVAVTGVALDVTYGQSPGIIGGATQDLYYVSGTTDGTTTTSSSTNIDGVDSLSGVRGNAAAHAKGRQSWRQIR